MTKIVAVVLILAMMNYVLPTTAFADGAKAGTTEEAMDYAQREAMAVGLETFEGGSLGIAILVAAVIFGILLPLLVTWAREFSERKAAQKVSS